MSKSGVLQTRSHLSQIINRVMRGGEHIILKKNVPVAKIVPMESFILGRPETLIKRTKSLRKEFFNTTITDIVSWKSEGQK